MHSPRPFRSFLLASFDILERELPWAYRAVCVTLAPRVVLLRVDRDAMGLRFEPTRIVLCPRAATACVEVETGRHTILAAIDAETTLLSAVLDDQLLLRGSAEDILAFHDALMWYLHGAVRAPSFPVLLRRYRQES
jgi:hypothetical protein